MGIGQYSIAKASHTAEIAFVVRDEYQNKGIGSELILCLTHLAKKRGLFGFTAEVMMENRPMLRVFEKMGFDLEKRSDNGIYELKMKLRKS